MGLDMSMYKKHYVKNWEHTDKEKRHEVIVKQGDEVVKTIKAERVAYIMEDVAYWRKANAIHQWFVSNVADDEFSNGGDYYVTREQMMELRDTCKRVLDASELVDAKVVNGYNYTEHGKVAIMEDGKKIKDASVANELLPTQSGFFFGGTDYDEYYYSDIKDTYEKMVELLAEEGDGDFYYSANW